MQIGLLEPDGFSTQAAAELGRLGAVRRWNGIDLAGFLAPLDALFVRLGRKIDGDLLSMAPRLRWLCSPTTGHTHLDEDAIQRRGVEIISLRGEREFLETVRATPEHTFGLIIALLRRYREAFSDTLDGGWNRDRFRGEELYGNTVGIIGLGRVGHRVAAYCHAFGAAVRWHDPAGPAGAQDWTRADDIASLIEASRIVVLCASFAGSRGPIIGRREVELLEGRYLINTARGELVDEEALLESIVADRMPGVATDVVANETGTNRLSEWRRAAAGRNVILTPHLGGATFTSMERTELFIARRLAERLATS